MSDSIICVRIAQRVLPRNGKSKYDRFPFDRVYLGKKHLSPQFRRMFRYYMWMTLDQPLLDALNVLRVTSTRETRVKRDDYKKQLTEQKKTDNTFVPHIKNPQDWLLVVPTHVRTVYRKPDEFKEPEKSELMYILSNGITKGYNEHVRLPPVTLVTPNRIIPIICGVCQHVLDLHEGKCLPGQLSCKEKVNIKLRLDTHNSDTTSQSVEESGGDECP